jgi:hypothetical protein
LWRYLRVVLVLVAVLLIIGHFLPPEFQASATIDLQSPPESVWAAINDYEKVPVSDRFCTGVDVIDGTRPAWREHTGGSSVLVDTLESKSPELLVRSVKDEVVPISMRHEYRIKRFSTGSELTLVSTGEIRNGTIHVPLYKLMMRITGSPTVNVKNYLNSVAHALGEKSEAH